MRQKEDKNDYGEQQSTILYELELILKTVKQIDKNIRDSIEVLNDRIPLEEEQESTSNRVTETPVEYNYEEIIIKSINSIKEILKELERI